MVAVALALCTGTATALEDWPLSRRLVDEAEKLMKAGDLRGALGKYREAYAAAPDRECLFNIGVTYQIFAERGGGPDDMRLGIDSFEHYLKTRPPRASDRAEARANLAQLREMLFKATGERPKQEEKQRPRKVTAQRTRREVPDGRTAEPASLKQPAAAAPVTPSPMVTPEVKPGKPPLEVPKAPPEPQAARGVPPVIPNPAEPQARNPNPPPYWSPLRLTVTISTAAIGLVAAGLAIGSLIDSNSLALRALSSSLNDDPGVRRYGREVLVPEVEGTQRNALISFSIAGAAWLVSVVAAIWPRPPLLFQARSGTASLWILPAGSGSGLVAGGSF